MERKLTAIFCADVYGYSRLMGENEEATLRTLTSHRKIIDSLIEQQRGRFVNSAGDSVLAEFASVVNAVQCAVEIQTTLNTENAPLPPERRMEFRIGVNLGDVMVDGEQIYGDGVNVAARLESLADPGGICISGTVHEQVRDKLALIYENAGEQAVKNILRPVRVFRVLTELGTGARLGTRTQRVPRRYVRRSVLSVAGLTILVGTILLVQHLSLRPPTTTASIPPAQKPALPLPNIPSIAVLPFTNLSGDPSQEYFSDGITDELITELSRLPNLFVIARNSSFVYKGKPSTVQQVGRELGVRLVLEGSVLRSGNQLRITAQLADANNGENLWAEHFDRPLRDIFALQDDIVGKVVTTLGLIFKVRARAVPYGRGARPPDNIDAFDYYLRGIEYQWSLTKEGNAKARPMFEKAIALDHKYVDAYVNLGFNYWLGWAWQWNQDPQAITHISQLARQAIALDDTDPGAHMLLAAVALFKEQNYPQAIAEARRAIDLDPNFLPAYAWLAETLNHAGKPAEAIAWTDKAIRLDPLNRDWYLLEIGTAYTLMGKHSDAVPALRAHLSRYPNSLGARFFLTVSYSELGQESEARAEVAEIIRISPQISLESVRRKAAFKDQALLARYLADAHRAGLK